MKKVIFGTLGFITLVIFVFIGNLIIFENQASKVTSGKTIPYYQQKKSALLVLDIQEGTTGHFSTNPYYARQSSTFIDNCNTIIDSMHASNVPVIYIKNEISNQLVNILNGSFKKGSKNAALDHRLNIRSEQIFSKQKQDAFCNPQLDQFLHQHHISHLYIIGLDGAHCVHGTVCGALNRNYKISLISNAILIEQEDLREKMLKQYQKKGVEVI